MSWISKKLDKWARDKYLRRIVVDTSAVIDARIVPLCNNNFLHGEIVVPAFVIREIQQLADSTDIVSSRKGKRALVVLDKLKKTALYRGLTVSFPETDYQDLKEVDDKLVRYCQETPNGVILTADGNLMKVAQIKNVKVINLHTLAGDLRSQIMVGDKYTVRLKERSREGRGQAIGYLKDNTLVCVENAEQYIGRVVPIVITSVIQPPTGIIAFAKIEWGSEI